MWPFCFEISSRLGSFWTPPAPGRLEGRKGARKVSQALAPTMKMVRFEPLGLILIGLAIFFFGAAAAAAEPAAELRRSRALPHVSGLFPIGNPIGGWREEPPRYNWAACGGGNWPRKNRIRFFASVTLVN